MAMSGKSVGLHTDAPAPDHSSATSLPLRSIRGHLRYWSLLHLAIVYYDRVNQTLVFFLVCLTSPIFRSLRNLSL
eukprot:3871019-Amphidinium_carterae.1